MNGTADIFTRGPLGQLLNLLFLPGEGQVLAEQSLPVSLGWVLGAAGAMKRLIGGV